MSNVRLFEFEDFPWFPRVLRDAITDYLGWINRVARLYEPVLPLLTQALDQLNERQILDCCSGAGGPWPHLYPRLREQRPQTRLRLCDYFPNAEARRFWRGAFNGEVEFLENRIDAKAIPAEVKGFRTFFTSFHHFAPGDARHVLQDAVTKRVGIGIFESTQRGPLAFLWMLIVPLVVWAVTPLIRPFSWSRLALTYLVPLIPFVIAWDGLVSCLRTYSCADLRMLTDSLGATFEWRIGTLRGPCSPIPITYLIGLPIGRSTGTTL